MDTDVLVVGAGFAGLAIAHELLARGIEFRIVERAERAGGTWRDNVYPGCACDIPSHLYSLSWAPNPDWTRAFAQGAEIEDYVSGVAERFAKLTSYGAELASAHWNGEFWEVTLRSSAAADAMERVSARHLVMATGGLSEPRVPAVPGLEGFSGRVVHSAKWDPDLSLEGKHVAVIGTGASAIQVIPELAKEASHVTVFQRTPAWILPKHDRAVPGFARTALRQVPFLQKLVRASQYWRRELSVYAQAHGRTGRLISIGERAALSHLSRHVKDPVLRERLTPKYRMGCKRTLLSDDFYEAMSAPHVALFDSLNEVDGDRAIDSSGRVCTPDVIILTTGFEVIPPPMAHAVEAGNGSLADAWLAGTGAYLGVLTPDFPNLYWMSGPGSAIGANSLLVMLEAQASYTAGAIAHGLDQRTRIDVKPELVADLVEELKEKRGESVWASGLCRSWYQDERGDAIAVWPDLTSKYVKRARFSSSHVVSRAERSHTTRSSEESQA